MEVTQHADANVQLRVTEPRDNLLSSIHFIVIQRLSQQSRPKGLYMGVL